jgi:hypothetical protein
MLLREQLQRRAARVSEALQHALVVGVLVAAWADQRRRVRELEAELRAYDRRSRTLDRYSGPGTS